MADKKFIQKGTPDAYSYMVDMNQLAKRNNRQPLVVRKRTVINPKHLAD